MKRNQMSDSKTINDYDKFMLSINTWLKSDEFKKYVEEYFTEELERRWDQLSKLPELREFFDNHQSNLVMNFIKSELLKPIK